MEGRRKCVVVLVFGFGLGLVLVLNVWVSERASDQGWLAGWLAVGRDFGGCACTHSLHCTVQVLRLFGILGRLVACAFFCPVLIRASIRRRNQYRIRETTERDAIIPFHSSPPLCFPTTHSHSSPHTLHLPPPTSSNFPPICLHFHFPST
jgi:hypothetical protein